MDAGAEMCVSQYRLGHDAVRDKSPHHSAGGKVKSDEGWAALICLLACSLEHRVQRVLQHGKGIWDRGGMLEYWLTTVSATACNLTKHVFFDGIGTFSSYTALFT